MDRYMKNSNTLRRFYTEDMTYETLSKLLYVCKSTVYMDMTKWRNTLPKDELAELKKVKAKIKKDKIDADNDTLLTYYTENLTMYQVSLNLDIGVHMVGKRLRRLRSTMDKDELDRLIKLKRGK